MEENMKVSGKITIWKVLVFIFGMMEENMKGSTKMIKNMDMVYIYGLMEDVMKGIGLKVNNMVLELILFKKKIKLNMDFGKMEKELNGSIQKRL